jgi:TonB family protein
MSSRFALAVAAGVVTIATIAAISAAAPQQSQTSQLPYLQPGNGVSYPILLRQEQPRYPEAAMRAKIEGVVELQAIVRADGTVGDIRVLKSLDQTYGLDVEAIATAKKWLFKPGIKDGKPVATIVTLILEFRLDKTPRRQVEPRLDSPLDVTPPPTDDEFLKGTFPMTTQGLVAPKLEKRVGPQYTTAALQAKIEGAVEVEAIVSPDGTIARSRVTKSLDLTYGLDRAALTSVDQWTFEPGRLNGQAVPVAITVVVEFRVK